MIVDVTREKLVQDELRRAYRSLSSHLDNTPLAVIEWDHTMRVVRWSGQAESMFGFRADEVIGLQPDQWRFVYAEDRERILDITTGLTTGREARNVVNNRNYRADGTVLDCEWHNSVVYDDDGRIGSILSLVLDVTSQRRAAADLKRSDERLRSALRTAGMLGWEFDLRQASAFFSSNPSAYHGAAEVAAVRRIEELVDFVDAADRPLFISAVERCLTNGRDLNVEYRGSAADDVGRTRWFATRGSIVGRDAGGPARIIGVTTETTDQKMIEIEKAKLDRELAESRKRESLSVLAGGIAHDFNNLLTVILGNAGLIRGSVPGRPDLQPLLDSIETATLRGAELCRKMTAYAGIDRMQRREVDLRRIVLETREWMRSVLPATAQLGVDVAPSDVAVPMVHGDADQLRQMLLNLVTNAVEAIPEVGGTVAVRLEETADEPPYRKEFQPLPAAGRGLLLTVKDNGTGMTPEIRAQAFEPFFSTKFTGRGLGLAAVHGIARSHGAAIRLQSSPGRGTLLQIHFSVEAGKNPSAVLALPSDRSISAAAATASLGRALVVDDEHFIRELTASVLEDAGYQVESAADGLVGLALLEEKIESWSLVVLDRVMPGLDGTLLFDKLRAFRPELPIVMMSGYHGKTTSTSGRFGGPTIELAKPFRLEQFHEAVRIAVAAGEAFKSSRG